MKNELPFSPDFIGALGIRELNPVQQKALNTGLLDGKNMVVASPTASGKTAIAEMAIINHFMKGGKCAYMAPLKALASEKFEEFKEKYAKLGMKIAISIGDYDSAEEWLGRYDVIILTNEKMDSAIRHNAAWISDVTLVVADEIHMMNDASRGPTLEVVLTILKERLKCQTLALSATISNADEISKWLDAKLVKSDYRPVALHRGVAHPGDEGFEVKFPKSDREYKLNGKTCENAIAIDTLQKQKQILIFFSSRRNAESGAAKMSELTRKFLTKNEVQILQKASRDILSALSASTKQCEKLADAVKQGTAFHHAGLVQKQREIIEKLFKAGTIKVLTATPTLAFGVNIPAWRVLVRDVHRYSGFGSDYIPALEVHQMCGRAGRPKYDTEGEAIISARSENDAEAIEDRYLNAELEPIESKLAAENAMRMYVLALISMEYATTVNKIKEFFSKTFFGYQYGDSGGINKIIEKILHQLEQWNFVDRNSDSASKSALFREFKPAFAITDNSDIRATQLGKRVAQLYIDPLSAVTIMKNLKPQETLAYLIAVSTCTEMPRVRVKRDEIEECSEVLASLNMEEAPAMCDVDYEYYIAAVKSALIMQDWMDEHGEDYVLDKYDIPPGELYGRMRNAEWLLYAGSELALILEKKNDANNWRKLQLRVKHGVREELLRLVEIKGIGRARARKLWKAGIRNRADIRSAAEAALVKILGPKVGKNIKAMAMLEKKRQY